MTEKSDKPTTPSKWRWLLVVPALVFGWVVPGILIRISSELGASWIPGVEFLMDRWAEFLQSGVGGFCAVFFATAVAPRGKVGTSIVAALIVSAIGGASLDGQLWSSGLLVVMIAGAGIAVWYAVGTAKEEEPDTPSAYSYLNRGLAYAHLGQYQRAIEDFDKAIQLDPDGAVAYFNRGIAYRRLGQHQRAIQDYDKASQLDPDNDLAYYNRGLAYYHLGQHTKAEADFAKARSLGIE